MKFPSDFCCRVILALLLSFFVFNSTVEAASVRRLVAAGKAGNTDAMREVGWILWDGTSKYGMDRSCAIRWWKRAAREGDEKSMVILGELYEKGIYFKRSKKKARQCYERAEAAGSRKAAKRLARMEEEEARLAAEQEAREEEEARLAAEQKAREEEEARLAAEQEAREEEEARLAAEQEAREEEEARLAAEQKAQTNKAAEQTVAPSSAPAVAMAGADSKGPAPVDFTPRFSGSGKAPTRIDAHQITEFRGSGSDPYPFLASATEVRPDGSVGVYTGNNIPPGMKPYVNHSGRPDNGSAWGKHIAYRPMTKGEMVVENAPQLADAAVFSWALFESGVRDIENGEYASGYAKAAGAGVIIGGLLWAVGQALQGN